jgi:hypothetical protein
MYHRQDICSIAFLLPKAASCRMDQKIDQYRSAAGYVDRILKGETRRASSRRGR